MANERLRGAQEEAGAPSDPPVSHDPPASHDPTASHDPPVSHDPTASHDPPASQRLLLLAELAAPAGLVRLIEARGAQVVAEDSDLDERDLAGPVPADAETVEDLLSALANAYLSTPPAPRVRDLPRRLDYLNELAAERGAQAAICAYSKFCDLYLAEYPSLKAHFDELGIPTLLLELEDEAIGGQHRTRVEAFLEMMSRG
jgi:benzoyl-CoA reductase/2-hydroxyglutaryl-CoA dehydratase subunit BcrC/BadD/HgdB